MYQEHTLSNGLKILMVPLDHLESVSIGIFIRVGSRYETENIAGISHFIEHMLFKGSQKRPTARLMAEAIEGIGGVSDAYTSQETTVYYAKVAASQVNIALDYLADLVRNPLFAADDVQKERLIIGEEISMVYDSPESWLEVLLDQVIWPDHPLGYNVAGTPESLARINRARLVAFFKASYHPNNLLIAIGGSFNPEVITAEIARLLGDWARASIPDFAPAPPLQSEVRYHIEHRAIEQGHLALALPGLPRTHPGRYALSILNTILGDGMSSRLFLTIREDKGLAYAIDSGLNFLQDTGTWSIYAGVDPKRAPEALQAILDELRRLREEPIPPQELDKARAYLKGRLVLGLEDSYSQAAWVAYQQLFMNAVVSPKEVLAIYDGVTLAEVQQVAEQLIDPAAYNLAIIGPFRQAEPLARLITG